MFENNTVNANIYGKMETLTNTEKKIANFVLENYEDVLQFNVSDFAERAGVSEASIVRFCRSIGYKGYQDFKINAAKDTLPKEKHLNPLLEKDDSIETICKKIFSSGTNVLNMTLASLDAKKVEAVRDQIRHANKMVFFGSGGSILVARDAQHKFLKIGITALAFEDMDMQLMVSSLMKEGDLAFGISHSGNNIKVLNCLQNAMSGGATVVALTGPGKSAMDRLAHYSLHCASEKTMFRSESVSTRLAQLAIMDTLVASVAFKDYDDSYTAIQKTRKATSDNKG